MADGLHQPYPHYTRASYNALDHVNPVPKVRLSGKSPQVRPHASFRRSRAAVVVRGTPSMPCRMRLRAFWFRHVCSDRINVSVKAPPRKFQSQADMLWVTGGWNFPGRLPRWIAKVTPWQSSPIQTSFGLLLVLQAHPGINYESWESCVRGPLLFHGNVPEAGSTTRHPLFTEWLRLGHESQMPWQPTTSETHKTGATNTYVLHSQSGLLDPQCTLQKIPPPPLHQVSQSDVRITQVHQCNDNLHVTRSKSGLLHPQRTLQ